MDNQLIIIYLKVFKIKVQISKKNKYKIKIIQKKLTRFKHLKKKEELTIPYFHIPKK